MARSVSYGGGVTIKDIERALGMRRRLVAVVHATDEVTVRRVKEQIESGGDDLLEIRVSEYVRPGQIYVMPAEPEPFDASGFFDRVVSPPADRAPSGAQSVQENPVLRGRADSGRPG